MAYALRNRLRIVETAVYLADHGRLNLLLRQQVLLVPKRLGYFMQRDRAMFDTIPLAAGVHSAQNKCAWWPKACAILNFMRLSFLTRDCNPHLVAKAAAIPIVDGFAALDVV
jgi:hypothetical protein